MYDQREMAQRDYEWALSDAREEGREEGERLGIEKGKLAGKIQVTAWRSTDAGCRTAGPAP